MSTYQREQIWFKDPNGFVEPDNLGRFFPIKKMILAEQLNAVLRFTIYFALVLIILGRGSHVLFIPIAVALGTYLMYTSAQGDARTMREGLIDDKVKMKIKIEDTTCTLPSKDNPFMNVLQSDYLSAPNKGSACDIQDPEVVRVAEKMFVKAGTGLVRDSDDVFNRKASSRQFVTNPSTTIPNDQAGFASWLYGTPPSCKTSNRSECQYRT